MAELKVNSTVIVIGVIVFILIGINAGWFSGTKTNTNPTDGTLNVPSTLGVTVTLNTRNALSATGENANVSYYIFDSTGKYFADGTTSAGTADVVLNALNSYKILTYGATTYAPVVTDYTVPAGKNKDTLTIVLNPLSDPKIDRVQDALGDTTDSNITLGLGSQRGFKVIYSAGNASSEVYKPVIVVDYATNSTASNGVTFTGLTAVACPSRLSVSTGQTKVCFQDATLLTKNSPREVSGSIIASETIAPVSNSVITFTVIDTIIYSNPNYKSVGLSAFVEGTQNANDLSNVGRADSNSATLTID